jgi:hypothetical protein
VAADKLLFAAAFPAMTAPKSRSPSRTPHLAGWNAKKRGGARGVALQECEHGFTPYPHAGNIFPRDDGLAADVIGDVGEIDAGQLALLAG